MGKGGEGPERLDKDLSIVGVPSGTCTHNSLLDKPDLDFGGKYESRRPEEVPSWRPRSIWDIEFSPASIEPSWPFSTRASPLLLLLPVVVPSVVMTTPSLLMDCITTDGGSGTFLHHTSEVADLVEVRMDSWIEFRNSDLVGVSVDGGHV